jgi:Spy/CpxP family protein refolding chaperone
MMKMSKWLLCLLMALTFTAGPALAAKDGAKPKKDKPARAKKAKKAKKGKSALRGEYGMMAAECKLTDAQKTQLIEIVKAQNVSQKAAAEASKPLKEQRTAAKKAGNKDKVKELNAKLKALQGDPKADRAKVLAILTDEQKASWAKFSLFRNACRKFRKAKLTGDQKKAIRDLCAASNVKVTGDRKTDAQALKGLTDKIAADILTDEQRTAIKPKPKVKKDKPAGDKKKKKPADK